jgi:EmrB/QacA subfamily drug resistance transporter
VSATSETSLNPVGSLPTAPLLPLSRRRRIGVTAGVMLGMFLAALEATVVSTAMPTVVASLGGIERYSWVFSAYLLTSTVSLPLWGKLSDLYGRRKLYQAGVGLFLFGSVLCGVAQTMTQLVAARAVQGLGAGALVPLALTIIGEIYTIQERSRMQGFFSGVWGLASVLGPLVGGYITDQLSWRWVFFINLPFGLLAAIVIGLTLIEPRRTSRASIDYLGATTLTAAITLLLFALVEGWHLWGWTGWQTIVVLGLSLLAFVVFGWVEKHAEEPIVPFDLLFERMFFTSTICGFLVGMAMFGAISFIPLLVQGVWGGTATAAGSALTPLLLFWVLTSIVGGRILPRVGVRPLVIAGATLVTIGFVVLANLGASMPHAVLYADMGVMGVGMGLIMLTLIIAVQSSVRRDRLGIATSLSMFFRSIGGAIGVATMGAVLAVSLTNRLGASAGVDANRLLDASERATMSDEMLASIAAALGGSLHYVFWIGAVSAALGLVAAFWLPRKLIVATQAAASVE